MAKTTLELKLPDWAKARYGYGSGSGYGYGDGDGYGSGYGYGDGDGSGYGSGYGSGSLYWLHLGRMAIKTIPESSVLAFWKSGPNGEPANGGSINEKVHIGMKQKVD